MAHTATLKSSRHCCLLCWHISAPSSTSPHYVSMFRLPFAEDFSSVFMGRFWTHMTIKPIKTSLLRFLGHVAGELPQNSPKLQIYIFLWIAIHFINMLRPMSYFHSSGASHTDCDRFIHNTLYPRLTPYLYAPTPTQSEICLCSLTTHQRSTSHLELSLHKVNLKFIL